jgi:hypothetical protein
MISIDRRYHQGGTLAKQFRSEQAAEVSTFFVVMGSRTTTVPSMREEHDQ